VRRLLSGLGRLPLFRRLSWQLAGLTVALLVSGLAAFGVLAWRAAAEDLEQSLGRRLVTAARLTALHLERQRLPDGVPEGPASERMGAELAALADSADLERLLLLDLDGRVLADSAGQAVGSAPYVYLALDQAEWMAALAGKAESTTLFGAAGGRLFKSAFAPVRGPDGKPRWVLRAEASARFLEQLHSLGLQLLLMGLLALGLSLILALWLSQPLVGPLQDLIAASRRVAGGDFGARVSAGRRDELGRLGETFNDMAQRLGALVRQRERLAALGEVAAGMAHEIRNPLAALDGYAQLAEQRVKADPVAARQLREVRREVAVVNGFIHDFLAYARPRPPQAAACDLAGVADAAARVALPAAKRRRWRLKRAGLKRLPAFADAGQLRQVLVNLLTNAREAQPKGGWVELQVAAAGGQARLSVRDGGPGIPAAERDALFKPFATTKPMGTGLGLSIAQALIEGMGGRIDVESAEGEGSCFTVWLPLGTA
jgi:signal transduction histidine kinase